MVGGLLQTVYAILFRTAAETLRRIGVDPKHLGAEIGLVAVLHTWGQTALRKGRASRAASAGAS